MGCFPPGQGAQAAGEVRGAQRRSELGVGGRARASLGRGALPRGPVCNRRRLPSLPLQRRPPGIPGRAPPLALRSAPFHLDFCRRGNFGFGDDLRSYWLPAGGVGGHGCSRYSAPRGAAQRLVSSQQVPSASPGVTCARGSPWSRLLMQIHRPSERGGGREGRGRGRGRGARPGLGRSWEGRGAPGGHLARRPAPPSCPPLLPLCPFCLRRQPMGPYSRAALQGLRNPRLARCLLISASSRAPSTRTDPSPCWARVCLGLGKRKPLRCLQGRERNGNLREGSFLLWQGVERIARFPVREFWDKAKIKTSSGFKSIPF